jgi:hypothetical protein
MGLFGPSNKLADMLSEYLNYLKLRQCFFLHALTSEKCRVVLHLCTKISQ